MEFVTEDISKAQANVAKYKKYDKDEAEYFKDIEIIEKRIEKQR